MRELEDRMNDVRTGVERRLDLEHEWQLFCDRRDGRVVGNRERLASTESDDDDRTTEGDEPVDGEATLVELVTIETSNSSPFRFAEGWRKEPTEPAEPDESNDVTSYPLVGRPPVRDLAARIPEWARDNRQMVWVAAAVAAFLVVGTVIILGRATRTNNAVVIDGTREITESSTTGTGLDNTPSTTINSATFGSEFIVGSTTTFTMVTMAPPAPMPTTTLARQTTTSIRIQRRSAVPNTPARPSPGAGGAPGSVATTTTAATTTSGGATTGAVTTTTGLSLESPPPVTSSSTSTTTTTSTPVIKPPADPGLVSYSKPPTAVGVRTLGTTAGKPPTAVAIGDVGVAVQVAKPTDEGTSAITVFGFDGSVREVPLKGAPVLLAYGPGDVAYVQRDGALAAVPLSGPNQAVYFDATVPTQDLPTTEYRALRIGHGAEGLIDRTSFAQTGRTLIPYVDTGGVKVGLNTASPGVYWIVDQTAAKARIGGRNVGGRDVEWNLSFDRSPDWKNWWPIGNDEGVISYDPPAPSAASNGVFWTQLGPWSSGDRSTGNPTQWVIARLGADGSIQWWSVPAGWQVVASDLWGTVLYRATDQGFEIALAQM